MGMNDEPHFVIYHNSVSGPGFGVGHATTSAARSCAWRGEEIVCTAENWETAIAVADMLDDRMEQAADLVIREFILE